MIFFLEILFIYVKGRIIEKQKGQAEDGQIDPVTWFTCQKSETG